MRGRESRESKSRVEGRRVRECTSKEVGEDTGRYMSED